MTMRVKVLQLITELVIGGAQDNTLLCVERLPRSLYEVHTAGAPGGGWVQRAGDVSDRLHLLPHLRRDIAPVADGRALLALYRLLRREQYHIIHTHSSKAGLIGRLAARLARVPVVVHTVHGFPFNDQSFPGWLQQVYLYLERAGALLSDQLVMVAELNRQEALQKRIAPANKMAVIYSGLELQRFERLPDKRQARTRLGLRPDFPVVGTVGRLSACNGPLLMVDTARRLLDQFETLQVAIIGDGELRAAVATAMGGEIRIRLLGFRDDIPHLLPALDVFLFPNLWGGLGRSVTEALAAGLPVVAFPVNGVPELIEDGVTGLHARVGDTADMARKTAFLLNSPTLGARLGEAGRRRVYERFGADKMVDDLDQLYRRLLAARDLPFDGELLPKRLLAS